MTTKRHRWVGGTRQHCENGACGWHRLWMPSERGDGETKRRPVYEFWLVNKHHEQTRRPECGSTP